MKSILSRNGKKLLAVIGLTTAALMALTSCIQQIPAPSVPSSNNTIEINATLDGAPWTGPVNYALSGPQSSSGSTVADTLFNLPNGSYTLAYESGGPSGAILSSITPSPTQTVSAGGTIVFTLNFASQSANTIGVNATLNGAPWSGIVSYTLNGPQSTTGSSVPQTFSGVSAGSYTLGYNSGGPPGAVLSGITPSPTQAVSAGATITFTLDFNSQATNTSTIEVNATLDGFPWSGSLNYLLNGPQSTSGSGVPNTFSNLPGGTYTLDYQFGGPPGATLSGISPSPTQTVSSGGTIAFTLDFSSQSTNTIEVDATLDGSPWSGTVHYGVNGPVSDSGSFVSQTFSDLPAGTYTLDYQYGGPPGAALTGISPSPTQIVSSGDAITFILRFSSQSTDAIEVEATLDGRSWSGTVHYSLDGPVTDSDSFVPQTFSDLPDGTYTLNYHYGGPSGAVLTSITPSPTQDVFNGDTITFRLNFSSQGNDSIEVEATLDGAPWSGNVNYSVEGPVADSGSSVPRTFSELPDGTYTLNYHHGGPSNAVLTNITPSASQSVSSGDTITFTLNFSSQPAGTIEVDATLDGSSWSGTVGYTISGPRSESGSSAPQTFSDMPGGSYTLTYRGGGPQGARLSNITPSSRQNLPSGGAISFTLNFSSQAAGTIEVDATLDGSSWSGTVNYTISGPGSESGSSVPSTFSDMPAGSYTLTYRGGGPEGARLSNITPSSRQDLSPGGTISFTFNFSSQATGTIEVDATLDGSPWSGTVSYNISGPHNESSYSAPGTFSDMPSGSYTLTYRGGGPQGARLSNITPSSRQDLSSGGTISFTLNFRNEP